MPSVSSIDAWPIWSLIHRSGGFAAESIVEHEAILAMERLAQTS